MQWHYDPSDFSILDGGKRIERRRPEDIKGIVGKTVWLSADLQEFRIRITGTEVEVFVGVADATQEAELARSPILKVCERSGVGTVVCRAAAAQGVHVDYGGSAKVVRESNSFEPSRWDPDPLRLVAKGLGLGSTIDVRTETGSLSMAFDGGPFVDLGVHLPEKVAPWIALADSNTGCEFHMVSARKVLQLDAQREGSGLTVTCTNIAGELLDQLIFLDPKMQLRVLVELIILRLPPPNETEWQFVLPSAECLEEKHLDATLGDTFCLQPGYKKQAQAAKIMDTDVEGCLVQ